MHSMGRPEASSRAPAGVDSFLTGVSGTSASDVWAVGSVGRFDGVAAHPSPRSGEGNRIPRSRFGLVWPQDLSRRRGRSRRTLGSVLVVPFFFDASPGPGQAVC